MSTTIANQLIDLNINLNEIYNQAAEQTKLIGDLYDTIESLSTPITQPTPVLLVNGETGEVTSTLTQTQSGYVAAGTKIASLNLKDLANTGLIPSNIVAGATIFGVEGTASSGIDTSDATASTTEIMEGYTAYVNNTKITGTLKYLDSDVEYPASHSSSSEDNFLFLTGALPGPAVVGTDLVVSVPRLQFGKATSSQVLSGATFTSEAGFNVAGTMVDRGAVSPTALGAGETYTIPAGYHNGSGKVTTKIIPYAEEVNV